jgi:hypothetical protein
MRADSLIFISLKLNHWLVKELKAVFRSSFMYIAIERLKEMLWEDNNQIAFCYAPMTQTTIDIQVAGKTHYNVPAMSISP